MATFKAYSRLDANSQVVKRPSLSGFSVIEMVDAYSNQPEIEKYNGKYFYVHLIRKVQLFPLQPGHFILEPAEVESTIHLRKSDEKLDGLRNLRELFRRGRAKDPLLERQITFQTPPVGIHVNPLPDKDQPDDFSGAVGNFSLILQMTDTASRKSEPAIVKLLISGTGNFPLVTDPVIQWPAGIHVSEPIVTEDVNKYVYPLAGVKTFEYRLDHQDTGSYIIPPVKFSYFDPSLKIYRTVESIAVRYTISEGSGKASELARQIISKSKKTPLQFYYFALIALAIIALIVYYIIRSPKGKA